MVTSRASTAPVSTSGEGIALRSKSRNFKAPKFLVSHLKDTQARLWGMYSECIAINVSSMKEASEINFQQKQCKVKRATTPLEMIEADGSLAQSLSTHSTIRRYVDLACDLYYINTTPMIGSRVSGAVDGCLIFSDTLVADLTTLREYVFKLLNALTRRYGNETLVSISTITNLYHMFHTFTERGVPVDSEDLIAIKEALDSQIQKFSTNELLLEFAAVTNTVSNSLRSLVCVPPQSDSDYSQNQSAVPTTVLSQSVTTFYETWQPAFGSLFNLVGKYFQKSPAGRHVIRQVFTQILEINNSLRNVVLSVWENPPCRSKLISNEVLRHEITTKYEITL